MKKLRTLFVAGILLCLTNVLIAQDEARQDFDAGNQAYQSENYEGALEKYLAAAQETRSFELYYNLGNTYFKLDSLGRAILYFERAREINPESEDLAINLQIARQQLVDRIEPLPSLGVNDFWDRITAESRIPLYTVLIIAGLFLSALIYFIMLLLRKNREAIKPLRVVFILTLAFSIVCFLLGFSADQKSSKGKSAIVMSQSVKVRPAAKENKEALFTLHEGTKVIVTEREGDWVRVQIANGSIGWLRSNALETI
jgi:tetratricopeptide (TPR) repeat protein